MGRVAVLLLEDDEDLRTILALFLEQEGFSVTTADNGAMALASLADGARADVIVCDLIMPGMNGWEFRRRQLQDPALADIPFVVVSSLVPVNRVTDLDAVAVLRKPVDPQDLIAVLETYGPPPRDGATAQPATDGRGGH